MEREKASSTEGSVYPTRWSHSRGAEFLWCGAIVRGLTIGLSVPDSQTGGTLVRGHRAGFCSRELARAPWYGLIRIADP